MIHIEAPTRKQGQQPVISLATEPLAVIRIAFVGLGKRGMVGLERWLHLPDIVVTALCDLSADNLETAGRLIESAGHPAPILYQGPTGYRQLCARPDVDLVYVCTDWLHHSDIAVEAMRQGKHVAIEVPAAMTLDDIWLLVDTAEQTRRHCMMLENSVYDFFELAVLNMARHGIFGDILHAEGGYLHNLEGKWEDWRMHYNACHRGDIYPTHGFGPACQLLNIHRTDWLDYLVAMDTQPVMGPQRYHQLFGETPTQFLNGDQTTTLVRTRRGRTIVIQHNVMTPQPYNRLYQVTGTDGYAIKYPVPQICLSADKVRLLGFTIPDGYDERQPLPQDIQKELLQRYEPSYVSQLKGRGSQLDHYGGMAYFMDYRLCHALHEGLPLDMDVYDLAEWCSLAPLSEISLEHRSEPVSIPDFTRTQPPCTDKSLQQTDRQSSTSSACTNLHA